METDLLAPPFAQAAHAIAANDRQYDSVLVAPEDTKAQNRTAAMAAEGATTLYWQHSKIGVLTPISTLGNGTDTRL